MNLGLPHCRQTLYRQRYQGIKGIPVQKEHDSLFLYKHLFLLELGCLIKGKPEIDTSTISKSLIAVFYEFSSKLRPGSKKLHWDNQVTIPQVPF